MNLMKCNLYKISVILVILLIFNNYIGFCSEDLFSISNSSDIEVLIDNGNISKSTINDDICNINIDTNNLYKGYYTACLSKKIQGDYSDFSGISFYINTNDTLKINLNLQSILGNNYAINEDSKILICYEDGNYYESINESYSLFEIPKGFSGNVYIPFSNMYDKDGNNINNELNTLDIIRIIVGLEETNNKNFQIGNFAFINGNSSVNNEFINETHIIGDNEILIPEEGQNISNYNLYSLDKHLNDDEFYLKNNIDGVYITKDGKLTVSNTAREEQIQIISSHNNSKYIKNINLKKNITVIPNVNEVENIPSSILLNNYFINFIQIVLLCLFVLFIVVYKNWRKILNVKQGDII